jgi:hypothetical protein
MSCCSNSSRTVENYYAAFVSIAAWSSHIYTCLLSSESDCCAFVSIAAWSSHIYTCFVSIAAWSSHIYTRLLSSESEDQHALQAAFFSSHKQSVRLQYQPTEKRISRFCFLAYKIDGRALPESAFINKAKQQVYLQARVKG